MTITALNPTLTRAGMAALFSASSDGLQAKISHLGFGEGKYSPSGNETGLQSEVTRVAVAGGRYLGEFEVEIVGLLEHSTNFDVAELGVFLDDGTLLAVWSDPVTPLAVFTVGVPLALSYILALEGIPPGSVTVTGDLDLSLSFAGEFSSLSQAAIENMRRWSESDQRLDQLARSKDAQIASLNAQIATLNDKTNSLQIQAENSFALSVALYAMLCDTNSHLS